MEIEGQEVCGRYIRAKNNLEMSGKHPLPEVFRDGGAPRPAAGGKGKGETVKNERVHSVMGLVQKHEGEYRQWHHAWGPVGWPRETEDWEKIVQPAVGGLDPDHALVKHHQLVVSPMTSAPPSDLQSARRMAPTACGTTIVRRCAGQPSAATYEARNVFITSLPEVLLCHRHRHTASRVYKERQECESIIGKRPRRGRA